MNVPEICKARGEKVSEELERASIVQADLDVVRGANKVNTTEGALGDETRAVAGLGAPEGRGRAG